MAIDGERRPVRRRNEDGDASVRRPQRPSGEGERSSAGERRVRRTDGSTGERRTVRRRPQHPVGDGSSSARGDESVRRRPRRVRDDAHGERPAGRSGSSGINGDAWSGDASVPDADGYAAHARPSGGKPRRLEDDADEGFSLGPSVDDDSASVNVPPKNDFDDVARIASQSKSKRLKQDVRDKDNRSTRLSHVNTMQEQTDVLKRNRFIRIGVYVLLVGLLGLGVYRAVAPAKTLTVDDVQNVIVSSTGDYGFPVQSGEGIAKQFIQAFIESQGDPDAQKVLSMYYNGTASNSDSSGAAALKTMSSANVKQYVDKGPYVFNIVQRSAYSCNYEVAVQVSQRTVDDDALVMDENGKKQSKMEYFMVGVYYNPATNKFGVSKDSPTVMPETQAYNQQMIPESDLPGDGVEQQDAKTDALTEMLTTYMNAYAESKQSTLGIITNNSSTARTKQGLNGQYTVDGNIDYTVYGDGAANKYKVLVSVNLKDNVAKDSSVTYHSKYTLSVVKEGEKYYVTDIRPFVYTVSEDTQKKAESTLGSSSSDDTSTE